MISTDIVLIRGGWAALEPIAERRSPFLAGCSSWISAIKPLFRRTNIATQREILMQPLTVIVGASTSSTRSCPRSRRSVGGMPATESARSTTRPSARRSCGRSSRARRGVHTGCPRSVD